jgi:3-oxo-5alpha-steroid 4-dehydrogenase
MSDTQAINDWGLSIDVPMTVSDPDNFAWTAAADMVVVGLGGAGVAAALEGCERGMSVIALDRYAGGGSSAANGGVFYAGGGTAIQKAAGEDDDPANMFAYLKLETGDVIADDTLRAFCESSAADIDWMMAHGVPFEPSIYRKKTSYPPLDKFLYHPDSTLAEPYRSVARPAARGHRGVMRNGNKAWGLGAAIYNPLRAAAIAKGLDFRRFAEARQLAVDTDGRVIGVRVERIADPAASAAFERAIARANWWMAMLPPTFFGSQISYGIGARYLAKAMRIEATSRVFEWVRARRGVVLSAGGFILNNPMVRHFAPKYAASMPNGTLGDTGSGIMLGVSVGAHADLMERVSAWRMINPPVAWSRAIMVNARGERFVNETLYGATIGDALVERNGGRAYIILDARLRKDALRQAFGPETLAFQRDITLLNVLFASKKAPSLDAMADRMGFDREAFRATVAANNAAARGETPDSFAKMPSDMAVIEDGPCWAIDASADSSTFPLACMTVGGLRVDEATGGVRRADGTGIDGLYAAGRTAIGLCSRLYVSGLSYADCVFSGRRAARAMAPGAPSRTLGELERLDGA